MAIQVCRPEELDPGHLARWTAFQAEGHRHGSPELANPFLAPEFARAVARHRPGVRVAVLGGADGEPAGYLPYQRSASGVGRAVGLGLSDCQGLVHRPDFVWDSRELLWACGLALWEFDHLAAGQRGFVPGVTGSFGSPVIDVDQGFESYLEGVRARSPSFLRGTRYKERKMGRRVGEVRYVHDERDPAPLETLMRWKSAQYRRTGRGDRFARPWIVRLVRELFETRTDSFAGQLSVLYAGDAPIAAHFGPRSPRVHSCWFPAYDPEFARYSPGLVLHLRMAEGAAASGISYLDLGRGRKEYKDWLKTRELLVHEGWVTRRHPVALAHRMRHAPVRALRNAVLAREELTHHADRLLKRMGSIRYGRSPGAGGR
ncbi:GNAT family N-acetyltransferase [Streptomyces sp. AJS327]|uniref:GNAT family N-acetyltransferase n=1 Tax=Streptomyces sp. AJS327 TaxID=2545265 RepID=UPI0015E057F9|nr:GNAT family N-acetyltransferase [Streptomyces sp. AJS327]MBA0050589.1 GNAT family N-acetyltransferase [Streptomyces sp. AJS327]